MPVLITDSAAGLHIPWDGHFPIVIGGYEEGEWCVGVSFNGMNPDRCDYVPMKDENEALNMVKLVKKYSPQSHQNNEGAEQHGKER